MNRPMDYFLAFYKYLIWHFLKFAFWKQIILLDYGRLVHHFRTNNIIISFWILKFKSWSIESSKGTIKYRKIFFITHNLYCILESFNTNISHQLFYYKINFVISQDENTNSKGDFVLKNRFETFVLNITGIQKKSELKIYVSDSDLVMGNRLILIQV